MVGFRNLLYINTVLSRVSKILWYFSVIIVSVPHNYPHLSFNTSYNSDIHSVVATQHRVSPDNGEEICLPVKYEQCRQNIHNTPTSGVTVCSAFSIRLLKWNYKAREWNEHTALFCSIKIQGVLASPCMMCWYVYRVQGILTSNLMSMTIRRCWHGQYYCRCYHAMLSQQVTWQPEQQNELFLCVKGQRAAAAAAFITDVILFCQVSTKYHISSITGAFICGVDSDVMLLIHCVLDFKVILTTVY